MSEATRIDTAASLGNIVEKIRKEANLTQKRLAEMSGLSTLYIIRAEQGMSITLPDNLLFVLERLSDDRLPAISIQNIYTEQRIATIEYFIKRVKANKRNKAIIDAALSEALDEYVPKVGGPNAKTSHPLYIFRVRFCEFHYLPTSAIKFCQMFGLHPATISEIEKRANTLEVDSVAYQHLKRLGMTNEQLSQLCKACDSCL